VVNLATVSPTALPASIAAALRIALPRRSPEEALAALLRNRQFLLLLDNCEHLLDGVSQVVGSVLVACPAVQIVATSRAPLRVRGEHLLGVVPLSVPEPHVTCLDDIATSPAVTLFAQRARAARPEFALEAANAGAVAEICRQLDGLPLAIELAAARSALLSPDAMLALMSQRLRLLSRGPVDAPPRHQALRAAIAWSHDLLAEPEQQLFRRLAVFSGGFTLGAAEVVAATSELAEIDVLETLSSLLDQSLVGRREVPEGEARFGMMETIAEFAREQLAASSEEEAARAAHAAYFVSMAEAAEQRLRGAEQGQWLARLEVEHANLRAALHWLLDRWDLEQALRLAGALGLFWRWHCHFAEGRQWLDTLLGGVAAGESRTVADAVHARALYAAGTLAWSQGDFARAGPLLEASQERFAAAGDARGVALALLALANQAKMLGDLDRASVLYDESIARFESLGDAWGIATLRHALGLMALDRGDPERAERMLSETVEQTRAIGERWLLAATVCSLGMAVARRGDLDRAEPLLIEAAGIFHTIGERRWIAHTLSFQGLVGIWRGDLPAALATLQQALGIARNLGVRFYIAEILERIAALLVAVGDIARAARLLGAAEHLREIIAAPPLPLDRAARDATASAARAVLGETDYASRWAMGREQPLEDVIAEALAIPAPALHARGLAVGPHVAVRLSGLTPRECEVLTLLNQRFTDSEIAARLSISRRTASAHVASILGKLGAANRRDAAAAAARLGVV
jgi:predicted ATPase/DNA-binding CsgD family transcriptional regulator